MPRSVSSEASIDDKDLPDASSPAESPATGDSDAMDVSRDEEPPKKAPAVNLEDLFDQDDDDDEFSSSMPAATELSDLFSSSPPPLPP